MVDYVIQYIWTTRHLGLGYGRLYEEEHQEDGPHRDGSNEGGSSLEYFMAMTDASFGDNLDRKSIQGILFSLLGGLILWKAMKQPMVMTSTMEAELLSLS